MDGDVGLGEGSQLFFFSSSTFDWAGTGYPTIDSGVAPPSKLNAKIRLAVGQAAKLPLQVQ